MQNQFLLPPLFRGEDWGGVLILLFVSVLSQTLSVPTTPDSSTGNLRSFYSACTMRNSAFSICIVFSFDEWRGDTRPKIIGHSCHDWVGTSSLVRHVPSFSERLPISYNGHLIIQKRHPVPFIFLIDF